MSIRQEQSGAKNFLDFYSIQEIPHFIRNDMIENCQSERNEMREESLMSLNYSKGVLTSFGMT